MCRQPLIDFNYLEGTKTANIQAMRKILLSGILVLSIFNTSIVKAQSTSFSFSCTRDTLVSCTIPCITLKARIPDLHGVSDAYLVNPLSGAPNGCYSPYVPPDIPGTPTNLTIDDIYSSVIPIGFNFPFFGTYYSSLVASTNGYVSFDLSLSGSFSHYTVAADLPSFTYDKALIMGPYHDLDPSSLASPPPEMRIKYDVLGTAPYRRWVFSFYHVPLYSNPAAICGALNKNTHQIVLYESTGIVEVFVQSKQICNIWNGGKAIIGMQDITRSKWIMAPNRAASSTPWGSVDMNESWRFTPTGGASLFKRVELFDLSGNLITAGTTTNVGNDILEASFPNVCPTTNPTTYIVKSTYQKIDAPLVEIYGTDTVTVTRDANLPVTASATSEPLCFGGTGSITVTDPLGVVYEYSVDGINFQPSPVFNNLPAATYTVTARIAGTFCSGSTSVTINQPALLTAVATPTSTDCSNKTGVIDVTAGGGTPAYEYSINNGINYQTSNQFLNLSTGNYNTIKVRDANGCISPTTATIALNDTMRLELGPDSTICVGSSITLIPQTNALTDTFKWSPKATLDYDTVRTPIAKPTDTTKYYLTAKWGICSRRDSITINVKHKPIANAGKDTTVCYKTNATLFGSASNLSGTVNFAWSPPDSLNNPNNAVTGVRVDTTRQFTLTVTDNYGCNFSVTDSVIVYMQPELVAFAGNDTNAIINRPHQLMATGRNAVDFLWSPIAPLNNPFIANPLAILTGDTYFYVHITDAIGCTDDDTIFIKAYEGPTYYLPNAFTPNGDSRNDVFFPVPVGIRSTDYFRVFDRYGILMYQTKEWMKGWDGTLKGKPAASGTYVWMIKGIDTNGSVVEMKGTVILIR